jgi:hypothetical protein
MSGRKTEIDTEGLTVARYGAATTRAQHSLQGA